MKPRNLAITIAVVLVLPVLLIVPPASAATATVADDVGSNDLTVESFAPATGFEQTVGPEAKYGKGTTANEDGTLVMYDSGQTGVNWVNDFELWIEYNTASTFTGSGKRTLFAGTDGGDQVWVLRLDEANFFGVLGHEIWLLVFDPGLGCSITIEGTAVFEKGYSHRALLRYDDSADEVLVRVNGTDVIGGSSGISGDISSCDIADQGGSQDLIFGAQTIAGSNKLVGAMHDIRWFNQHVSDSISDDWADATLLGPSNYEGTLVGTEAAAWMVLEGGGATLLTVFCDNETGTTAYDYVKNVAPAAGASHYLHEPGFPLGSETYLAESLDSNPQYQVTFDIATKDPDEDTDYTVWVWFSTTHFPTTDTYDGNGTIYAGGEAPTTEGAFSEGVGVGFTVGLTQGDPVPNLYVGSFWEAVGGAKSFISNSGWIRDEEGDIDSRQRFVLAVNTTSSLMSLSTGSGELLEESVINVTGDIQSMWMTTKTDNTGNTHADVYWYRDQGATCIDRYSAQVTGPGGVPGAPNLISAIPGDHEVFLDWNAPVTNSSGILQYEVWLDGTTSVGCGTVNAPTTELRVINCNAGNGFEALRNDQVYNFTVRARNNIGYGPFSNTVSVTPAGSANPPLAPTLLSVSPQQGGATVEWSAPDDGGSPIIRYHIYARNQTYGVAGTTNDGSTLTFTFQSLAEFQAYNFTVQAQNSIGFGPESNVIEATTLGVTTTPPDPPVIDDVVYSGIMEDPNGFERETFTITWHPTGTAASTAYFFYEDSNLATPFWAANAGETTTVLFGSPDFVAGLEYCFSMKASNSLGTSGFSNQECRYASVQQKAFQSVSSEDESNFNFDYKEGKFGAFDGGDRQRANIDPKDPLVAKNLNGLENNYRLEVTHQAETDGKTTGLAVTLSAFDREIDSESLGDRIDSGVFFNAVTVDLVEDGGDWKIRVYDIIGGQRTLVATGQDDRNPTTKDRFYIDYNGDGGTLMVYSGDGSDTLLLSTNIEPRASFHGLILKIFRSGNSVGFPEHILDVGGAQPVCLWSLSGSDHGQPISGGSSGSSGGGGGNGTGGSDGTGGGGTIGDPVFPGVDFDALSEGLGLDKNIVGWLMAILIISIMAVAFGVFVSPEMSPLGALLATGLTTGLGMTPIWFLVVLVILVVGTIMFLRRGGASGS